MKWLDKLPLGLLILIAVLMAVSPLNSTPHLLEKLTMLADGTLQSPLDIFDLLMHATPSVLLIIRLKRQFVVSKKNVKKIVSSKATE